MNFSVGDLVCTVKGPPAVGIIRAAYEANFYNWASQENLKHIKFTNLRKEHEDNYYTVEFPEPIRVITVEEIMSEFGWKYNESLEYLETLSKHKYLDFPEKFLSMFEG